MTDLPRDENGAIDWDEIHLDIHTKHKTNHYVLDIAKAIYNAAIDDAAATCANERDEIFISPTYATNQPEGSFAERFACTQCEDSIKELKR